ncbi:MAG TPA: hypothetical protein VM076_25190, partial [Gemmatimonadaceae bacterium]|nr:hypothetical protein [Gemmatimonadaceae bacterium]
MLTLLGCSDSPTVSVEPLARHPNVVSASSMPHDGLLTADVSLSRIAHAAVTEAAAVNTITVGGQTEGPNFFPFGGGFGLASRYQQAYAATQFGTSAPLMIKSIAFVGGQGTFATSTYAFSLSTITTGIDDLSTTNFNANRGPDNALLASMNLSGAAPATLRIEGATPFLYDPARGNLLLDIVVTPGAAISSGFAAYQSRVSAFGVMSRYHNFGSGFIGYGLITQFELAPLTIDNVLAVVDRAVENRSLTGEGNGSSAANRLATWVNMLRTAQQSAGRGHDTGPCGLLEQAYLRADGASPPPDFVGGAAAPSIAHLIQSLRGTLGC